MAIIDISVLISSTLPVYRGDPAANIVRVRDYAQGDGYALSRLDLGAHTGTHVDAPLHFIRGGKTADRLDLNVLIGDARVVDFTHVERTISARDLENANLPQGMERILFKTRNSALWAKPGFQEDFVALAADGAQWLVDRGVRLVGLDYLSVDVFGSADFAAHKILLGAGVVILESIALKDVGEGTYRLICLPLKLHDAEGAPARAVLIQAP